VITALNSKPITVCRTLEEKKGTEWLPCANIFVAQPAAPLEPTSSSTSKKGGKNKTKRTFPEQTAPRPGEYRFRFYLQNFPVDSSREVCFPFRATGIPIHTSHTTLTD
jgi:hypothetical protein